MTDLQLVLQLVKNASFRPKMTDTSDAIIMFFEPGEHPIFRIPAGHHLQLAFRKEGTMFGFVLNSNYKWIPVTERLPDTGGDVLVMENANRNYNAPMINTPRVARYSGNLQTGFGYTDGQGRGHTALNVTHWMPLPELPVEVK